MNYELLSKQPTGNGENSLGELTPAGLVRQIVTRPALADRRPVAVDGEDK
jgi:hypothetical protein